MVGHLREKSYFGADSRSVPISSGDRFRLPTWCDDTLPRRKRDRGGGDDGVFSSS